MDLAESQIVFFDGMAVRLPATSVARPAKEPVEKTPAALAPRLGVIPPKDSDTPGRRREATHTARETSKSVHSKASSTGAATATKKRTSASLPDFTVKDAFDEQLKKLTAMKQKAEADVPKRPEWLPVILQMPQVDRIFRFLSTRKTTYEKKRAFVIWFNIVAAQHNHRIERQRTASINIQRRWRGYIYRLLLWRRRQAELERLNLAVRVVGRIIQAFRLKGTLYQRIQAKKRARVYPMAALIQSVVRMFLYRRRVVHMLRKKLYRDLRRWSGGRVDHWLRRPGRVA